MKTYKYTPKWRVVEDKLLIEVVSEPTIEWFNGVYSDDGTQHVRFALLANGELYFGDGYHVLHWDICQIKGPSGAGALLVGVLTNRNGKGWRVSNCQWFLGSVQEERVMEDAKGLLTSHQKWRETGIRLDPYHWGNGLWKDPWE